MRASTSCKGGHGTGTASFVCQTDVILMRCCKSGRLHGLLVVELVSMTRLLVAGELIVQEAEVRRAGGMGGPLKHVSLHSRP